MAEKKSFDADAIWPKDTPRADASKLAELTADLVAELKQDKQYRDKKEVAEAEATLEQVIPANGEFAGFPDMPEECCQGCLGDLARERMPEFPRSYSFCSLIGVGAAHMSEIASDIRSNLYTALVGPVHSGKSQAIERAAKIMEVESPELIETYAGSMEQLTRQIGNPGGASRLLHIDELSHLFAKAQIDRASFAPILNTLFYKSTVAVTLGRKSIDKVTLHTMLSIIGGIVDERFQESFTHATTGGTHDRFLFPMCPAKFVYEFHPLKPQTGAALKPMAVRIDPSVWEAKRAILSAHPDLNPRVLEISMRVLLISFAYSGYKIMKGKDVEELALPFAEWQMLVRQFAAPEIGLTLDARCGNCILRYAGRVRKWMSWRELKRRTCVAKTYGSPMVERVFAALVAAGDLQKTTVGKSVMVRYVDEGEPEVKNEE